jgi:hypothetical protein
VNPKLNDYIIGDTNDINDLLNSQLLSQQTLRFIENNQVAMKTLGIDDDIFKLFVRRLILNFNDEIRNDFNKI